MKINARKVVSGEFKDAAADPEVETKLVSFSLEKLSAGEDGSFSGLAIPFDSLHDTSSWMLGDGWQDTVTAGAFDETLAEHKAAGTMPLLQWMHERGNIVGTITSAKAAPVGMRVEGKISPRAISPSGVPVLELVRTQAVGGLSIGFQVTRSSFDEKSKIRTIESLAWRELSVVDVAGAGPTARITDVKTDPRSVETALRSLGFSKKEAKVFVAAGIAAVKEAAPEVEAPPPAPAEGLAATKVSRQADVSSATAEQLSAAAAEAHGAATVAHGAAAAGHMAASHDHAMAAQQAAGKGDAAGANAFKAKSAGHDAQATKHTAAAAAMHAAYQTKAAPVVPAPVQIPDSSESLSAIVKKFTQDLGARRDADPPRRDAGDRTGGSIWALTNQILDTLKEP